MSSEKLEPDTSDDHLIPLAELEKRLKTSLETGLTATEAKARLERNGPNALSPPKQTPEWIKFCKTMFAGFAGILWSAAFLCFIAYIVDASSNPDDVQPDNLYVGGALTCVVIISGLFTYYQERSSGKIMDSFAKMVPPKARACRDGKMVDVEAADLVVGDIVEIQSGDKTPADIRILKCSTLKVDNSSLTGESLPCKLNPGDSNEIRIQSKNMAFFSTNVLEGKGTGVIIETGDKTVIGNIAGLVSGMAAGQTPINKEIKKFISVITFIAVFLAVSFFIIALSMGYNVVKATLFLIGILVANVPEGLLVTVTITLSLTAKRMAQKNCLVKHLEGVETLGSTSVICSDKTGTLTQNKMTVSHFWFNNKIVELDTSEGSFASGFDTKESGWVELAMVGCLCSTATFADGHDDESLRTRPIRGDASEQGILRCYESIVGNSAEVRESNPKVAEIPFNSSNKYQVSVHNTDNNGTFHLVMKGAPEIVFNYCSTVLFGDQEFPVDQTTTQAFEDANKQLGEKGERVLAFCDLYLDTNEFGPDFVFDTDQINFPLTGLRFVGLMSMVDPPKSTVPDAVSKCRSAGIKVIMVTGDQPITAAAIARKVGIIDPSHKEVIYDEHTDPTEVGGDEIAGVISGGVLGKISDETLDSIIQNHWEIVFARTSPEQKLRIVEGFQRSGAIVAVTGDGVNDSPALKKGDIGVAMGISGSEVSKEAADMILLDDNFATIVVGVEEGRLIFDNLKKSIIYTLTSNIPEIFPFLSWVILNIPLPLATITILLVDLGTDMLPAISLAHETAENDIMLRKPRNPEKDRLVNGHLIFLSYGVIGMMQMAAGFFTYFIIMDEHGWKPSRLFGIRSEWDNKELNNLEDSYGQEWTFGQRKVLEGVCQTAYFIAIVEVQWTDLIISKTRVVSITSQKMKNTMLNGALLFETILAIILIYTPTIPQFIGLYPLNPQWWIPALPFSLLIWAMDEFRRYLLRRNKTHPSGLTQFIENETYY